MSALQSASRPVVLLDVDNTLLDNDRVQADLGEHIEKAYGAHARDRYWAHYEALRTELDHADYLGAMQRLADELLDATQLDSLRRFLLDYPFDARLYPGALDALRYLNEWATPVILSDGEKVYQPHKVRRSGLWDAVGGRVLIYQHKETRLDEIDRLYPSLQHAMVDDKLRILSAMKAKRGSRLTTIFVRQGHYAHDPAALADYAPADVSIDHIADLMTNDLPAVLQAALEHRPNPQGGIFMHLSPLAGQSARTAPPVDLGNLIRAYYEGKPDPSVATQRVAFGTSGHRGSPLTTSFNEAHVQAISQAIC